MTKFVKDHYKAILAVICAGLAAYFAGSATLQQVVGDIVKKIVGM